MRAKIASFLALVALLFAACGDDASRRDGGPAFDLEGDAAPPVDAAIDGADVSRDARLDATDDLEGDAGSTDSSPPRPWLFLLAGQSNMAGLGRLYPWLQQASFAQLPAHVELYVGDRRLLSFAGQHDINLDTLDEFGPELTFVAELSERYPSQPLIIVKHAIGNTSMDQWLPSYLKNDGSEGTNNGSLYAQLLQHVQTHVAGRDVETKAVLWMQGESDAIDGPYALIGQRHQENLERLIARFRQDLAAPQLPFLFGKIYRYEAPHNAAVSEQAQFDAVRAAQEAVAAADPNAHLIVTDAFLLNDSWHFNGTSQFALGSCFAQVFAQRPSRYACPLQSGYDEAPIIIWSATPDGKARFGFSVGDTIYGRVLAAGSDGANLSGCMEQSATDTRCNEPINWTTSAPWSYDASAGIWRNGGNAFDTAGHYRGYWAFIAPARRGFATGLWVH